MTTARSTWSGPCPGPSSSRARRCDRRVRLVEVDHPGVDVRRPAHRRGVAEQLRGADHAARTTWRDGPARRRLRPRRAPRDVDGRVPGAEVLGGDLQAEQLADVVVDVRGLQRHPRAVDLDAQQPDSPGPGAGSSACRPGQGGRRDRDLVLEPDLPTNVNAHAGVAVADVSALEGGEAVEPFCV